MVSTYAKASSSFRIKNESKTSLISSIIKEYFLKKLCFTQSWYFCGRFKILTIPNGKLVPSISSLKSIKELPIEGDFTGLYF